MHPGVHWIEGWVGLRAVKDAVVEEKVGHTATMNRNLAVHYVASNFTY
jgi:hypothetical protein